MLVIHGSGGGYDQGELLVQAVLGEQFHWIVPSRFGYLRSTFREGATFDDQAQAYAYLLDQLVSNTRRSSRSRMVVRQRCSLPSYTLNGSLR